ncbi:nuclear transport factor 2 family protein [Streptomyces caniscabiei]|uniref:Nuclear transport factor 2 family protein n=1 Tax=Streptomyces caniscabiei TaxID=2746961 RepID=A0A927KZ96_9ACTN|nr:nuclear transport factor 2 family protein [Streptomyces caniscabiei]MBD9722467.1 nuclear transport factor 2 family protein [Streptomyces caniscabiei]MDX3514393.1 nuclear transport factor 2 family protein [Streptomyces caniscabiei]MDX3716581.1 nuclear transport factor 2 family protein [Streptomyces caniscabiei]MDX3731983.1 nuclear transport factor 2 family protein [Streptomyces caniscabiei]WEO22470.1 nuclear transport factor 2 family protein [Streptomyces caniscabiei]
MTSNNVDIAREYFQAVQKGDLATVGELLDEGIVWHQPGANRFSGERKGRDAVFAMLGGMMEASQGSFAIDTIHALMGNGDMVAASIHFAGRREDASMGMDGVDVLRLKDGKIVEMWLFSGDQVAEDAFWGQ